MKEQMVPTFQELMHPFLAIMADGQERSISEIHDLVIDRIGLSQEDSEELLPSGNQTIFRNRLGWARTYMFKAGLLERPRRAHYRITQRGLEVIRSGIEEINLDLLSEFREFVEFYRPEENQNTNTNTALGKTKEAVQTPEEVLESAYKEIHEQLSTELLEVILRCSPAFFERLVIDVITAMGYGGSRKDAGEALGKTGDGGIDGIIKEDRLGLDVIYVQAKRWENSVPVREVRDFAGALLSKKAKKGIFIATSSFPASAYDFVKSIEPKIVLIDGSALASLMIENKVGVSPVSHYTVSRLDSDYFSEE